MILIPVLVSLRAFASTLQTQDQKPQSPITAFPNGPKAPPPNVKDLPVPPAPVVAGPMISKAGDLSTTPLSADEAVRIALRLQPSLGLQIGAIQSQQGRTGQVAAVGKPQVGANAGYNTIGSISGPGAVLEAPNAALPVGASATYLYSAAATIRQLIFDFNQTRNLVRQSEALEGAAKANLTAAQMDLVLQVEQLFYNLQTADHLVKVNEDNVANRQRQLDLTSALFTSGIGRPSDVATAQASKSQAVLALNQARDSAEQARIQLLLQMGIDPLVPVAPAADEAPAPSSRDALVLTNHALRTRPEILSAQKNLYAAQFGLDAAKAVDLPNLYAQAGVGLDGYSFPLKDNVSSLGIGLSIPIVDGGYRAGSIQQAKGEITAAISTLKSTILQVRSDVAAALMSLLSAEQRISITDNEVFNAGEALRLAEGRYAAGVGLFLDITNAQSVLLSAQTDQANARNSLAQARTSLQHATGDLDGFLKTPAK